VIFRIGVPSHESAKKKPDDDFRDCASRRERGFRQFAHGQAGVISDYPERELLRNAQSLR
jgi:hypothetical protein